MGHPNEPNRKQTILIDSDAFVAFVKADDSNHARAVELFNHLEHLPVVFVTSNYVFAEAITVISQRVGHEVAIEFSQTLQSGQGIVRIRYADKELDKWALDIFKKQSSKNTSFVDCANMALLQTEHIPYIFSFDAVYKANGYRTVEALVAAA